MPCRLVVGRRGQLLTQSRPERGFQAGGDTQRIDHRRPALAILHRQHFGQRARLCRKFGVCRIGGGLSLARGCERRPGGRADLLRGVEPGARRRESGFGDLLFRGRRFQRHGFDGLGVDPIALCADLRQLLVQPPPTLLGIRELSRHGLGASIGLGRRIGGAMRVRFRRADCFDGCRNGCFGGFRLRRVICVGLSQPRVFRGEPQLGRFRIHPELFRVSQILAKLSQPHGRIGQGCAGTLLLGRDLLLGHPMALECGAGVRFDRAKRRQRRRSVGRLACGLGRGLSGGSNRHARLV